MEPSLPTDPPLDADPPPTSERSELDVEPVANDERAEEAPPPPPRDRSKIIGLGAIAALVAVGVGLLALSPPGTKDAAPAAVTGTPPSATTEAIALAAAVVPSAAPAPEAPKPPPWRLASLKSDPAIEVTDGTFGKRGLVQALTGAGLARSDVKRLVQAFEDLHRIERPAAADTFSVARDKAKGSLVAFEYGTSPLDVWQARVENDELTAKKLDLAVEHKRVAAAVVIAGDLAKAMSAAGFRAEVIDVVDDALEGHLEPGSLRSGARLRVVSNEDWVDGSFVRVRVEAVELVPAKPHAGEAASAGAPVRVYYYERDASAGHRHAPAAGYYDAKGRQPYHGQFRTPIPLARVTSRFNPKRMHPVLHTIMPHNGVDFGGATGTPIYAAGTGTVSEAGNGGPCGNMVRIEHAGGLSTAYCHMSRFAAGLHSGQHVEARQLIGYVGATGRVTGPHLHFVVKRNGNFIDPLSIKMDGVRVLPPSDRDAFAKKRTELDSALDGIALPSAVDVPDEAESAQDEHEE